ncbi:MAG: iron-sulfur cluster assembly accessory protein [Paraglaciecola psychrophila]|jgi:iron-sulfur cluster assembly accessory protein
MTVSTFNPQAQVVTMTAAAISHFERSLKGHDGQLVRLATQTSGCTGYAYVLELVERAEADDIVLYGDQSVTLAVAAEAMGLLHGTEIDYVSEGVNSVIKFNNPNVIAECGCGESFSVA